MNSTGVVLSDLINGLVNNDQEKAEKVMKQHEADMRSIFVSNVHIDATPELIEEHFESCGTINRITILLDKHTGKSKGNAYVEFNDIASKKKASQLNGSKFMNLQITISDKRTNVPKYKAARFKFSTQVK